MVPYEFEASINEFKTNFHQYFIENIIKLCIWGVLTYTVFLEFESFCEEIGPNYHHFHNIQGIWRNMLIFACECLYLSIFIQLKTLYRHFNQFCEEMSWFSSLNTLNNGPTSHKMNQFDIWKWPKLTNHPPPLPGLTHITSCVKLTKKMPYFNHFCQFLTI